MQREQPHYNSTALRCPTCRVIVPDGLFTLVNIEVPCPRCGARNESRVIWPSPEVCFSMAMARQHIQSRPADLAAAASELCSVSTSLLEEAVERIAQATNQPTIGGADSAQRQRGSIDRLQSLTGLTLTHALEQVDFGEPFSSAYEEFAIWCDSLPPPLPPIERFYVLWNNIIGAFIQINNRYAVLPVDRKLAR